MIFRCPFIQIFVSVITFQTVIVNGKTKTTRVNNWINVETLAESNPYIVALLNIDKQYICTGSVIDKSIAVTSGNCVSSKPRYIVVGASIFSPKTNKNNIFDVSYTVLHSDYNFELRAEDPNVTKMHSNIGLVFVSRPILEVFIPAVEIGDFYAEELKEKKLNVIGYGPENDSSNMIVLQQQAYYQAPCSNPKWYYCICGMEYLSHEDTYVQKFGKGAPVLYDSKLIGISAAPCGLLTLRATGIKYNIFTVISPYLLWIQKNGLNQTTIQRATLTSNTVRASINLIHIVIFVILLFISKVFF
ncbi:hypothetical protein K1T71_003215 [Dendrolimus kikuchii]|uniref:Uncharacterized protein n=1 Tax=Dendrolimus kikuchii TaxID=765133 RepID=A0ACC1DBD1_9NEOP|nr:hypothetical protein K1T71_003215 [Dendrolimus kikuchii]